MVHENGKIAGMVNLVPVTPEEAAMSMGIRPGQGAQAITVPQMMAAYVAASIIIQSMMEKIEDSQDLIENRINQVTAMQNAEFKGCTVSLIDHGRKLSTFKDEILASPETVS